MDGGDVVVLVGNRVIAADKEAVTDVRARETTYRNTVRVLGANTFGLSLALLKGVLVLELASHIGGWFWGWKVEVADSDACWELPAGRGKQSSTSAEML